MKCCCEQLGLPPRAVQSWQLPAEYHVGICSWLKELLHPRSYAIQRPRPLTPVERHSKEHSQLQKHPHPRDQLRPFLCKHDSSAPHSAPSCCPPFQSGVHPESSSQWTFCPQISFSELLPGKHSLEHTTEGISLGSENISWSMLCSVKKALS